MHLSRAMIARSAVAILDEYGLADVSMRRVANNLGVAPGALYWHVDNKQSLLAAMAEQIIQPVLDASYEDPRLFCAQLRATLLHHRDGAEVVSSAAAQPQSGMHRDLVAAARQTLPTGDHDPASLDAAASGLIYLTLGAAAMFQSGAQLQQATGAAGEPYGAQDNVERAITLLLEGLAH